MYYIFFKNLSNKRGPLTRVKGSHPLNFVVHLQSKT